jgi:ABC-type multidrug transport system fused ATPase/permease subunit
MRLQLLGALIATSLSLSAILTSAYGVIPISSGLFGLSLSYSFSIVNNLNGLVSASTETEQEMVSVERVQEYVCLDDEYEDDGSASNASHTSMGTVESTVTSNNNGSTGLTGNRKRNTSSGGDEEDFVNNSFSLSGDGKSSAAAAKRVHELTASINSPSVGVVEHGQANVNSIGGTIEFRNVSMRYASHLPLALKNISLVIPAGSKVAVVGRTGSGKSSLLRTLLRLNSLSSGTISIGGVNICDRRLSKQSLRRQIIVIPQEPVLLTGSVKLNLDPTGQRYNQQQLLEVLQACGFVWTLSASNWKEIRASKKNVETEETDSKKEVDSSAEAHSHSLPADFDIEAAYGGGSSSPSRDGPPGSDAMSATFSHWLKRTNTGEVGESVLSGFDLAMVLDWKIENAGSMLSQGQRQLLSLARALLPLFFDTNPRNANTSKVVLIDEATAAIDPAAEAALVAVLAKYFAGAEGAFGNSRYLTHSPTLIMICHRKDGIRRLCDKVRVSILGLAAPIQAIVFQCRS